MAALAHDALVMLKVQCAHCRGAILLECEGLPAYLGYQTYHEYICPRCRKRNVERTDGVIVSARPAT
jgi:hypothetical protein